MSEESDGLVRQAWTQETVHGAVSTSGEVWRAWGVDLYQHGMSVRAFCAASEADALRALAYLEDAESTLHAVEEERDRYKAALERIMDITKGYPGSRSATAWKRADAALNPKSQETG